MILRTSDNDYSLVYSPELKVCEHLLNLIYLNDFPRIHHDD